MGMGEWENGRMGMRIGRACKDWWLVYLLYCMSSWES